MSLVIDETELVKQIKDQGIIKDLVNGFYEYKIFGFIPVSAAILLIPAILYLKKESKKNGK
jgi:hypothetical protein